MRFNPILAILFRNEIAENYHRGAFCLIDENNKIIAKEGNIEQIIFPHSAIKPIQAVAVYLSGAKDRFSLSEKEIALICASHYGEKQHVEIVKYILQKINCTIDDLACGAHAPINREARNKLFAKGEKPTSLHNACSGKHAGMLAIAKAINAPLKDYFAPNHKVQKLVNNYIEQIVGNKLSDENYAIDGCSVPTYAGTIKSFALAFAKMAAGKNLSKEIASACDDIFSAMINNPYLVGGDNSLDSDLINAFNGRLIIKNGSDGVYCGALLDKNIGFALKIDDGNLDAAKIAIANILLHYSNPSAKEKSALEKYQTKIIKNWRGLKVAIMKPTAIE